MLWPFKFMHFSFFFFFFCPEVGWHKQHLLNAHIFFLSMDLSARVIVSDEKGQLYERGVIYIRKKKNRKPAAEMLLDVW